MPSIIGDGCLTKQDVDTLNTALAVSGLGGGAIAVTTLAASGASTLTGNVTMGGTLSVASTATFASAVTVAGVLTALTGPQTLSTTAITANGAIDPHTSANYVITKAGVAAMTLAAPTATTDDGLVITIVSDTTNAHTVTATGLYGSGSAAVNLATFAAFLGAGMRLMAYQAKWLVMDSVGVTFS